MKLRNDFVSNSSSSSFIIATNNTYQTNNLIKDLIKNCYDNAMNSYSSMKKTIDTYVSLFIGHLKLEDSIDYWKKDDPNTCDLFEMDRQVLDGEIKNESLLKHISYANDEHTIIKYVDSNSIWRRIVSRSQMKEILKLEGKDLVDYVLNDNNFSDHPSSYVFNEDSIIITNKLMALGREFIMDNDVVTYEEIKDRIVNKKEKLYNFHVNYDGDGKSPDCFYWNSNKPWITEGIAGEVLGGETY